MTRHIPRAFSRFVETREGSRSLILRIFGRQTGLVLLENALKTYANRYHLERTTERSVP